MAPYCIEDEEQCFKILKKCYDNGLRTFDTADMYSNGISEIIVGKFLKKYNIPRERVVILSKCYFPVSREEGFSLAKSNTPDFMNSKGLSRKHILDAAEASVQRLGTYVDVYQIHRLDTDVTYEEIMRALNDVVEKGWARYLGASSMKAYQFFRLQEVADQKGYHKFVSMQNLYNLLFREEEREMNAYCKETGVGIIPWSPNARGLLTRPLTSEKSQAQLKDPKILQATGITPLRPSDETIVNRVEELSKKYNVSMMEISVGWLIEKDVIPIVGVMNEEAVDDLVKLRTLNLSKKDIEYLEEPYEPKFSYP